MIGIAKAVSAGDIHTCAVTTAGAVYCWGDNYYGQLGTGNYDASYTAAAVSGLTSGVSVLSSGHSHVCASTTGGTAYCWGYNLHGQVGDGTNSDQNAPVVVSGLSSGVSTIASGLRHTCALKTDGSVYCWGLNGNGQVGDGTSTSKNVPTAVSGLTSGVTLITAGYYHSCSYSSGSGMRCWGANGSGQIGDGTTTTPRLVPTTVSGMSSGITAISAGLFHTCSLRTGGSMYCWGSNSSGRLGNGNNVTSSTAVAVSGMSSDVTAIGAGYFHTCSIRSGYMYCWGDNRFSQLGDGTTTNAWTAISVSGIPSQVTAISPRYQHSCALTSGAIYCTGVNTFGQLGDSTTTSRSYFAPVSFFYETPTIQPTAYPSVVPSRLPTADPTLLPSPFPTFPPTFVPSATPTPIPSSAPSTMTPSFVPTELPTVTPTEVPSMCPSALPTVLPSFSPSELPSFTPTELPTLAPTALPSFAPTELPSFGPTLMPSFLPTFLPTELPSFVPTYLPSYIPTLTPTELPTFTPSEWPSYMPSAIPTELPTLIPTELPSFFPSFLPTSAPPTASPSTSIPSQLPTFIPSDIPTEEPSLLPTETPTVVPSVQPSVSPEPSPQPSYSMRPTEVPTMAPSTYSPTELPTFIPTPLPTEVPTEPPSHMPTPLPSLVPTEVPTVSPQPTVSAHPSQHPSFSLVPTEVPTQNPTHTPTIAPSTIVPTALPTTDPTTWQPSFLPTEHPSEYPSMHPSVYPSVFPSFSPSFSPSTWQPTVAPSNSTSNSTVLGSASASSSNVAPLAIAGIVIGAVVSIIAFFFTRYYCLKSLDKEAKTIPDGDVEAQIIDDKHNEDPHADGVALAAKAKSVEKSRQQKKKTNIHSNNNSKVVPITVDAKDVEGAEEATKAEVAATKVGDAVDTWESMNDVVAQAEEIGTTIVGNTWAFSKLASGNNGAPLALLGNVALEVLDVANTFPLIGQLVAPFNSVLKKCISTCEEVRCCRSLIKNLKSRLNGLVDILYDKEDGLLIIAETHKVSNPVKTFTKQMSTLLSSLAETLAKYSKATFIQLVLEGAHDLHEALSEARNGIQESISDLKVALNVQTLKLSFEVHDTQFQMREEQKQFFEELRHKVTNDMSGLTGVLTNSTHLTYICEHIDADMEDVKASVNLELSNIDVMLSGKDMQTGIKEVEVQLESFSRIQRINEAKSALELTAPVAVNHDKLLGAGKFANVYEGTFNDQIVAVKELNTSYFRKSNVTLQALKEIGVHFKLSSLPGVVKMFGVVVDQEPCLIVMEKAMCCLSDALHPASEETLDVATACDAKSWTMPKNLLVRLDILRQIADTMVAIHAVGVLHRDIKSMNILLFPPSERPLAKVADFGFARHVDSASSTAGQFAKGTLAYMAPEVFAGSYSFASDAYAFAIMASEILFSTRPYSDKVFYHDQELPMQVKAGLRPTIPPVNATSYIHATLYPDICRLLNVMWHKDASKRLTFKDCIKALDAIVQKQVVLLKHGSGLFDIQKMDVVMEDIENEEIELIPVESLTIDHVKQLVTSLHMSDCIPKVEEHHMDGLWLTELKPEEYSEYFAIPDVKARILSKRIQEIKKNGGVDSKLFSQNGSV